MIPYVFDIKTEPEAIETCSLNDFYSVVRRPFGEKFQAFKRFLELNITLLPGDLRIERSAMGGTYLIWKEDKKHIYLLELTSEKSMVGRGDRAAFNIWFARLFEKFAGGTAFYASPSAQKERILDRVIRHGTEHGITIVKDVLFNGQINDGIKHVAMYESGKCDNPGVEFEKNIARIMRMREHEHRGF